MLLVLRAFSVQQALIKRDVLAYKVVYIKYREQ